MRRLHVRELLHRKHRKQCPNGTTCSFHDGTCSTCGFRLVDQARDEMREREPRY